MVERQLPKLHTRVRFPSPAPNFPAMRGGVCQAASMVGTFKQAVAQILQLAEADQENISRRLFSHVEELNSIRDEVDQGLTSLDAGKGRDFNIEEFLVKRNSNHGGA
jgi:hypothetical protein